MNKNNSSMENDYTKVKPYNHHEEKTKQLARMFNKISGQYDQFNDFMTWGLARIWRKVALSKLKPYQPKQILDIATGTADMCIKSHQYLNPNFVTGVDISYDMLTVGRAKVEKAGLSNKTTLEVQDCASLSFKNESFDAVTIGFGIRNFEKLDESLQQIHRVLTKNGHLLILEMNEPQKGLLLKAYKLYTRIFVKMTAQILSTDKVAYDYLTESMHAFPNGKKLIEILNTNGFNILIHKKFGFGVCSMYLLEKR